MHIDRGQTVIGADPHDAVPVGEHFVNVAVRQSVLHLNAAQPRVAVRVAAGDDRNACVESPDPQAALVVGGQARDAAGFRGAVGTDAAEIINAGPCLIEEDEPVAGAHGDLIGTERGERHDGGMGQAGRCLVAENISRADPHHPRVRHPRRSRVRRPA